MKTQTGYTERVKAKIRGFGADLVGVADVAALEGIKTIPPDLLDSYTRAVSIALSYPLSALEGVKDCPTAEYVAAYMETSRKLDAIAAQTARLLEDDGHTALVLPVSLTLDRTGWYGGISHKAVARMAGLGWQGKSLLIVTPEFGPRVRLVTVLTDAPLVNDGPIENKCGTCTACQDACPAGAIKGVSTGTHYESRDEAVALSRCIALLYGEFAKIPGVGGGSCGVCIRACPYSRRRP
jgi:epoxyqueuosine reductase